MSEYAHSLLRRTLQMEKKKKEEENALVTEQGSALTSVLCQMCLYCLPGKTKQEEPNKQNQLHFRQLQENEPATAFRSPI